MLTELAVKNTAPGPTRREIPDRLLPGLYLIVQPSGKKSWAVRYARGGRSRKLTLGQYPVLGLAEARKQARAALIAVQAGADPAIEKKAARAKAANGEDRFGPLVLLFVERHWKTKTRAWREQARLLGVVPAQDNPDKLVFLNGGIAYRWQHYKISDIRKADIIATLDDIVNRGARVVANRTLAALRKFFNWAVERDLLTASPCAGVKPPSQEKSRDRVLTDDELKAVWNAARARGYPYGPIVQLLILTGQRRNEVAHMRWDELDFGNAIWNLPRTRVKNDVAHTVPLSAAALEILRAVPRIADSKYVFTTNGIAPFSGFGKAKAHVTEHTGLNDWRLHDLRRTFASGLARLGIQLPVIERILNHVSGSFGGVVGVYQRHSFANEKRAALEAWGRFVTELVTDAPANNVVPLQARG